MFESPKGRVGARTARRDPGGSSTRIEGLETRTLLAAAPAAIDDPVPYPLPEGPAFRVNTFLPGGQSEPKVAGDAAGDFVVVWTSEGQATTRRNVYAQRYAADGTPVGGEFRVNSTVGPDAGTPSVAMDDAGNFVVVWERYDDPAARFEIFARRYNSAGAAQGAEFRVSPAGTGFHRAPAVDMTPNGDFVVAWDCNGAPGGAGIWDVCARRYAANGTARGNYFRVNPAVAGGQFGATVAVAADGAAVIAWQDYDGNFGPVNLFARRYGPDGAALGGAFRVNQASVPSGDLADDADDAGNFAIGWGAYTDGAPYSFSGFARLYDATGAARGDEFMTVPSAVNSVDTSLAMDGDGDFVVTAISSVGLSARLYGPAGEPRGPAFRLTAGFDSSQSASNVAFNGNGTVGGADGFVVAWVARGQDPPPATRTIDVFARRCVVDLRVPRGQVVDRHVFYRHNAPGVPSTQGIPADDAAIAPDKQALLPGQAASFANVTSYDKGLNGIMVDVTGLRPDAVPGPSDFGYAGATPAFVSLRSGAGTGGSDRVTLLWPDHDPSAGIPDAVADGWLTVTAKAGALGLARSDVFSFGNLIGETGDGSGTGGWRVSALDLAAAKRALNTDAAITSPVDFNRDGRVNALDLAIVKRSLNLTLAAIPPAAIPPAAAVREKESTRATDLLE